MQAIVDAAEFFTALFALAGLFVSVAFAASVWNRYLEVIRSSRTPVPIKAGDHLEPGSVEELVDQERERLGR